MHKYLYLGDNYTRNCISWDIQVINFVYGDAQMETVKRDFRPYMYIRRHTCQNENFEYDYYHSNALRLKDSHHSTKCEVMNEGKLFWTVYSANMLTLSNQTSR